MRDEIEQLIANATADKKMAQAARKDARTDGSTDGNYTKAITLIQRAVKTLETVKPRLDSVEKGAVSAEDCSLAEALADVYGSSGGIYRSAEKYKDSVKAYDDGAEIEQDQRFGFVNSYNLTQRLVARVLLEPKNWIQPGQVIEGKNFAELLGAATTTVETQTLGPRANDVWAWADLAVLRILSGDAEGADIAFETLVDLAKQPFVFDSTNSVISDLLKQIDPVAKEDGADQRLVETAASLRNAQEMLTEELRERLC
jgi:tetratricopeptide (TPR) repeat protein